MSPLNKSLFRSKLRIRYPSRHIVARSWLHRRGLHGHRAPKARLQYGFRLLDGAFIIASLWAYLDPPGWNHDASTLSSSLRKVPVARGYALSPRDVTSGLIANVKTYIGRAVTLSLIAV